MTTLNFDNYKLNIKNMSIKRFNDINDSDSVIDILKKLIDDRNDERDNDALYHLGIDITNYQLIKKSWKKKFESFIRYIHDVDDETAKSLYDSESENLETLKLDDNIWEFIAFSDGYDGHKVTFTNDDNKLRLVKCEPVGENECNQYGMDYDTIYKLLN